MKRFLRDTLFCSLFIFSIIGLFASITLFRIFDVFDPVGEMFFDFELTDIVFSKLRDVPVADENIIMVNIGNLSREGIARQIEILSKYDPAVIGVDVLLHSPKPWQEDSVLVDVLKSVPNVVMGENLINFNEVENQFDSALRPAPHLGENMDLGFVNLITGAKFQNDLKQCRSFTPRLRAQGEMTYAFAVKLALAKDSLITKKFLDRNNEVEVINYKGNIINYSSDYGVKYYSLDVEDIFEENFAPELVQNKVIVMCYLGNFVGDIVAGSDAYYTPMNEHYVGKAVHDMYGGVVHANIISMILDEDYIDEMSLRL